MSEGAGAAAVAGVQNMGSTDAGAAAGPGAGGAVAPTTADAGAANVGGQPQSADKPWYADFKDEGLRGYAQVKGWTAAEAAIESYKNLESRIGRKDLVLPKDDADEAGWNQVYESLGRPKAPADYGITVPEGGNAEYINGMAEIMHKAGLSTKQVQAIVNANNEFATKTQQAAETAFKAASSAEMNALRQELGAGWDMHAAAAQSAAHQLGIDKPKLDKLERALGTREMFDMLASIGKAIGEDTFEGNREGSNAFMSPEAARARKSQLMNDQAWADKYRSGDVAAREEMRKLNEYIASTMGAA